MLIKDKKHFYMGFIMAVGFACVFAYMFTPNFGNGLNAFEASDKMFNSISKGSTNYIPGLQEQAKEYSGTKASMTVLADNSALAQKAAKILTANAMNAAANDAGLQIEADMGKIISTALEDSLSMFNNNGTALADKYGMPEKEAMFVWWKLFKSMDMELKHAKRFKEAKFLSTVVAKGVEVGYNYYKVEPESASSKIGMLSFSLIFYVIYTMWWGYSIFFMFEGIGLVMTAGAKKEV